MDSTPPCLDFAAIGHQDSWENIVSFVNEMRTADQEKLSAEKIKQIFSFIPPRDLFRVKVKSKTGTEINGVFIETFIDPDKLDARFARANINKVAKAAAHAIKMKASVVTLGGFTSIVLEGNLDSFAPGKTKFTTGNTLTAAYIVKGIEEAASQLKIELHKSEVLIIGATGDIGMACVNYLKKKVKKLLLCARNNQRLEKLAIALAKEDIHADYSTNLQDLIADAAIIICVASSTGIRLADCKKNVLICDAGYPKNLEAKMEDNVDGNIFHGGMGRVTGGFNFSPDYSNHIYQYPAPYVIHGCILEAMILAFENKMENYSAGKGNITTDKMEEIYTAGLKHGITLAPFFNDKGLW
jgi:fatty aldehyde-generating acyl-ACP reductase